MRKRRLTQGQAKERLRAVGLILAVALAALILCSCTVTPTRTLKNLAAVQTPALAKYVETANQAIAADQSLTAEDREAWQAVGEKLIRNQADIQRLLEGKKNAEGERTD